MFHTERWIRPTAIAALLFGIATIASGGLALFGGTIIRSAAGDAVPFVLWFNFLAGFAYVLGGIAILQGWPSAGRIAGLIAAATGLVFIALIFVASRGTAFEWRTIGAMTLRTGFWLVITMALHRHTARKP